MGVDSKEFGYCGLLAAVLLESVSDVSGEGRCGGNDHSFGWMNGTVEVCVCEAKPALACLCDSEVYFCVLAHALELNIVNVELEWHLFADGAVGAQGF